MGSFRSRLYKLIYSVSNLVCSLKRAESFNVAGHQLYTFKCCIFNCVIRQGTHKTQDDNTVKIINKHKYNKTNEVE